MKNIIALNHVSLLVADTARSLDFYQGLLGLELDQARPTMDFPGAWLIVGAAQIHLLELPQALPRADLPEHGGCDQLPPPGAHRAENFGHFVRLQPLADR